MRVLLDESVPAGLRRHLPNRLPIAVVVLDAPSNSLTALLPLVPGLIQALTCLTPYAIIQIN